MAKHVTLKELKQDAVLETGERILEYLDLHRTKILTIVLVVAALVLAARVSVSLASRRAERVSGELNKVYGQYQQTLLATEADERAEAFATLIGQCDDLIAGHASSFAGREALYIKSVCYRLQEDDEKAAAAIEEYLGRAKNKQEQAKGQLALAGIREDQFFRDRENKNLAEQAKTAYEQARQLAAEKPAAGPTALAAEAMMGLARLHEQLGELDKAKELYKKLVETRAFDEDKEAQDDEEEDQPGQPSRETQAKMFRESMKRTLRQFAYKQTAEERLERLEALK